MVNREVKSSQQKLNNSDTKVEQELLKDSEDLVDKKSLE